MRRQPPNYVNFRVPLSFNKFDLRDYLYNAYSCPVLKVQSWIINSRPTQKLVRGAEENTRRSGRWYRPQAKKYMSVRLAEPFVVPSRPPVKELKPWDYDLWRSLERMKLVHTLNHPQGRKEKPKAAADTPRSVRLLRYYNEILPLTPPGKDAVLKATAKRAQKLLRGEEKWEGNGAKLDAKWVALTRQLQEKEKWKMGLIGGPSASAIAKKPEASRDSREGRKFEPR